MDFCCFYFPLFCIHWLMVHNIPSVAYATVYPIAMVVLILFIQIIASAVY